MTTFLSFLIVALVLIGIVQIVRIFEIASKLNKPSDKPVSDQDFTGCGNFTRSRN